ncbi:TolB amino-terminal domain-containing protein [Roseovarius azorensis]|uniref:TolB amino-terminal domain-containing protein n=1 Tax=Roseovarius azorensis TaxID=1287727 RepID=A0A1H7X3G8_9RHOB|nr:winged helix-turn-helix domain-containing protein [Roseovarius azorensis]SEM28201.1 TolB amino-terminal domain-containing protein [Roseovarius azorensis]
MNRSTVPPSPLDEADGLIRFGPFEIDSDRFELRQNGHPVPVEPRTFDLIRFLARNIGRTVTRDEIFDAVWQGRIVSDAALSSQIRAARRALGDDGDAQQVIATIHGRGFRLRRRVASAQESEARVSGSTASARTGLPTLVVLPCTSLDSDGRGTVLAQGMTEDMITALSKNRWLRVIPRSTAFALNRIAENPAAIACTAGADYMVAGSVRRSGNRVRVAVQTIDTRDMRCLWSECFDRDMTDIFELQDEIARLVSARVATELGITEQQRAARQPRKNLGAWELYQLGSIEFYRFTGESNRRCQRLLRQAIQEDADFGAPYARLAYAMILEMVYFDGERVRARMDEALNLALRGVDCDDQDANTHFALGRVRLARCEYESAIDALEEALQLNPCLALCHCGLGDSFAYEGRLEEAISRFQTAIDLSPHDPFRWAFMSYRSLAHLFGRKFDEAAHWARRATQVPNAHFWAHANLVSALGHLSDGRQLPGAVEDLKRARPDFSRSFARERLFYIKDPAQLDIFLEGLRLAGIQER